MIAWALTLGLHALAFHLIEPSGAKRWEYATVSVILGCLAAMTLGIWDTSRVRIPSIKSGHGALVALAAVFLYILTGVWAGGGLLPLVTVLVVTFLVLALDLMARFSLWASQGNSVWSEMARRKMEREEEQVAAADDDYKAALDECKETRTQDMLHAILKETPLHQVTEEQVKQVKQLYESTSGSGVWDRYFATTQTPEDTTEARVGQIIALFYKFETDRYTTAVIGRANARRLEAERSARANKRTERWPGPDSNKVENLSLEYAKHLLMSKGLCCPRCNRLDTIFPEIIKAVRFSVPDRDDKNNNDEDDDDESYEDDDDDDDDNNELPETTSLGSPIPKKSQERRPSPRTTEIQFRCYGCGALF